MIRIYGTLPETAGNIEVTRYGTAVEAKVVEIAPDGSWIFDGEANSRGDYESFYLFKFPDKSIRKIFLDRSLPSKIAFADLIKGAPDTALPSPEPSPSLIETIDDRIAKAGIKGIEPAIAALNPDTYLGTIGLLADEPVGAKKPHYTAWPAADAGAWLWAKSDTAIAGQAILTDQNWVCLEDGTPAQTPSKWDLSQKGEKKPQYAIHSDCIGTIVRALDLSSPVVIPSRIDQATAIPFVRPSTELGPRGIKDVFQEIADQDPAGYKYYVDLGQLVPQGIRMDIEANFLFQSDLAGERGLILSLYTFYPIGSDRLAVDLERHNVLSASQPCVRSSGTFVSLRRSRVRLPVTDPLDEFPITYLLGISAYQDSGGPLELRFGYINISAWA